MDFCMTPEEIVAKVEEAIKDLPKEEADTVRAKVSLTLQKSKTPKDNLQKSERLSLKNLKKDKDIIILPADKGRTTVIMNTLDYINKCNEHINKGPYKLLKKDPTEVIKREANTSKRKEYIDDKQYYRLKPCDGPPPRFYGLPKIHKQGNPIRPIVSCTGTPLYNLSKFVASILSKFTASDHSKNSKEFSEYTREIKIADDECMISFDVTPLYTNVPIKDTLNIIKDLIENDAAFGEKIPVPDFLCLVELVLTKTWYLFNKNFYTQTDGVAMGGPASSVVAEI
ncbi:uncharacterized protein LOC130647229 [Hydractinia symbiolongicarpus]|uniref:uncharacterized protein LOC130647229 n=1 Tax=Hydractinia symbiolongicarpus TaxID=13093 RepID=UPI00254A1671|nr:uncharacterized protein LOC130647229 [Hydractinia symbiolongicarpus]